MPTMRLLPLALSALLLAGCGRAASPAAPAGARAATAVAAAATLELRRAIRARAMMAFDWADTDHDGILVRAEATRLDLDEAAFMRHDKDQNGALSFPELMGADTVTDEVRRLRDLSVALTDAAADHALDRAEFTRAAFAVQAAAYTPSPSPDAKAALFAPSDRNGDGQLDRNELEAAFGTATGQGYTIVQPLPR